jgi:hypothetical protein
VTTLNLYILIISTIFGKNLTKIYHRSKFVAEILYSIPAVSKTRGLLPDGGHEIDVVVHGLAEWDHLLNLKSLP